MSKTTKAMLGPEDCEWYDGAAQYDDNNRCVCCDGAGHHGSYDCLPCGGRGEPSDGPEAKFERAGAGVFSQSPNP